MRRPVLILLAFAAISFVANGQTPVVVQSADTTTPAQTVPASPAVDADTAGILKMLQEMKAQNADTLKKQEIALDLLDQLQKEAEQIRIFSKRN